MPRPQNAAQLIEGPVGSTLLRLAAPMLVGMAAIFMFQTVDTFFVGQLGVLPLAAMSFTFPVTFILISITVGIGVGATAVIGRAIGKGDAGEVRRLSTDALLLSVAIVTVVATLGLLTIDPVFRILGADEPTLVLVRQYMLPWYLGIGLLVIPMVGNSLMRASGDTKTPMVIMLVAGFANLVLDPIFIFGFGPVPRMELQGAAIATVLSWVVTFVAALTVLHVKKRMLEFSRVAPAQIFASWRRILAIAMPAALSNTLHPLSSAVLTAIMARFGADAVAAFGVGTRIEMVATVGVHSLAVAMMPFVAQNYGAKRLARIREGLTFSVKAAFIWGLIAAGLIALFAAPLAGLFTDSREVLETTTAYLYIVPISYGAIGCVVIASALFNALHAPLRSTALVAFRAFGLVVPLGYLGGHVANELGALMGIAVGNLVAGLISFTSARGYLARRALGSSYSPAAKA